MNRPSASSPPLLARTAAMFLCCICLVGCAPSLVSVLREDPRDPGRYADSGEVRMAGAVALLRGGRRIAAALPAMLQAGDEIETGPDALAKVRYADGNEVVLDSSTRVRVGSLLLEFGRILVRAHGLFSVDTETVITGVEGTEYILEVTKDRSVVVIVLNGVVVCQSRRRSWEPVRLRRGEAFLLDNSSRINPQTRPASLDELKAIRTWVDKIDGRGTRHAPSGYCCENGQVSNIARESCRGYFSPSMDEAASRCEHVQEGYCCDRGSVYATSRERCERVHGRFDRERREVERACVRQPEPGYCCDRGKVHMATRDACERALGSFHAARSEAERGCARQTVHGYCCDHGRVLAMTRDNCQRVNGSFNIERSETERACAPPLVQGFCCVRGKPVFPATRDRCVAAKGRFFTEKREAGRVCSVSAPDPDLQHRQLPDRPVPPVLRVK